MKDKDKATKPNVQAVVITGLSGSGKSTALKSFEDMGYFCVDNMPVTLLTEFFKLKEKASQGPIKIALVMDVREPDFLEEHKRIFKEINDLGFYLEVLFLDARDEVLVQRFNQTRRKHPLAQKRPLIEGIRKERELLRDLKEQAARLIDTSNLNVHQLRKEIMALYSPRKCLDEMVIHLVSFGFKYGVPAEANLVFDARFLPNPFFVPQLRPHSGLSMEVQTFVLDNTLSQVFVQTLTKMMELLLPAYKKEGKSYLVIAVGCTGGRHRSVAIVEHLKEIFTSMGEEVIVTHRDLELEAP